MSVFLSRSLGGIPIDVVINENHTSEMTITKHPVERGVRISDHAWREPREVELECIIDGPGIMGALSDVYRLQEEAEPFDLVTGLQIYPNMLIQGVYPIRDLTYSRVLKFNVKLQEVLIVSPSGPAGGGVGGVFGQEAGGIGPFGGLLDLGFSTGGLFGVADLVGDIVLDTSATLLDGAVSMIERGEVQAREIVERALPAAALAAFGV